MVDGIWQRGRWAALLLIWAGAMIWTAATLRRLPAWQVATRGSMVALTELRAMQGELARYDAHVRDVQSAAVAGAPPLASLVGRELPGVKVDDQRERVQELDSGWAVREVDLVFRDVALSGVLALASAAERESVPRQLVACEIKASAHTPGRGDANLTIATIERR
jgi:hypothetical protein